MAEAEFAREALPVAYGEAQGVTTSSNEIDDSKSQVSHVDSVPKSNALDDLSNVAQEQGLSKNQLKKLRRKQEWEDGREARKVRRKEKNKARRERKRAAEKDFQEEPVAGSVDADVDVADEGRPSDKPSYRFVNTGSLSKSGSTSEGYDQARLTLYPNWKEQKKHYRAVQLPLTFIYDCGFDELMTDGERISLASQLTRCYSDNRKARFRGEMVISSFGGKLKERFEGILDKHHEQWKGVKFTTEDFASASEAAAAEMKALKAEPRIQAADDQLLKDFERGSAAKISSGTGLSPSNPATASIESLFSGGATQAPEVVYLTSDSPNTLEFLKPYSTYIIGGIVDKNRHKGICYRRACSKGIKTAKLPIGEYMRMSSRQVLATNHVAEIMLKFLECGGDWGKAFDLVIPKRKGAVLRKQPNNREEVAEGDEDASEEEEAAENLEALSEADAAADEVVFQGHLPTTTGGN